jgi:hypothetical protein
VLHRFLLFLLVVCIGQGAGAAVDEDLHLLEPGSPAASRLRAVGMVFSGQGSALSMASGFLISPCHVLTAAHVLARIGHEVQLDSDVRFVLNPLRGRSHRAGGLSGRVVAASPDFIMQQNPVGFDQRRTGNDWALIELDQKVSEVEPMKLVHPAIRIPQETTFDIAGFPLGEIRQGLYSQESCRRWGSGHGGVELENMLIIDCAVRSGMSGGPILFDGAEEPVAAGIVSERFTIGKKVMTIAVPVAAFAEKIEDAMRASDVCAVGSPFVWPANTRQ